MNKKLYVALTLALVALLCNAYETLGTVVASSLPDIEVLPNGDTILAPWALVSPAFKGINPTHASPLAAGSSNRAPRKITNLAWGTSYHWLGSWRRSWSIQAGYSLPPATSSMAIPRCGANAARMSTIEAPKVLGLAWLAPTAIGSQRRNTYVARLVPITIVDTPTRTPTLTRPSTATPTHTSTFTPTDTPTHTPIPAIALGGIDTACTTLKLPIVLALITASQGVSSLRRGMLFRDSKKRKKLSGWLRKLHNHLWGAITVGSHRLLHIARTDASVSASKGTSSTDFVLEYWRELKQHLPPRNPKSSGNNPIGPPRETAALGECVRALREYRNFNRATVAEKAGLGVHSLALLEQGWLFSEELSDEQIKRLAAVLQVCPIFLAWLLKGASPDKMPPCMTRNQANSPPTLT